MEERLNTLYQLGLSLFEQREYDMALACFREAAELFHPGAQYQFARCLEWGIGVEADADEAIEWYKRAAELGNEDALVRLGVARKAGKALPDNKDVK